MTISFDCPGCGHHFQVGPEMAGRRCRCTKCQTELSVPAAATSLWDELSEHEQNPMADRGGEDPTLPPIDRTASPYASPALDAVASASRQHEFANASGLVTFLSVLFIGNALFDAVFIFLEAAMLTMDVSTFGTLDLGDGDVLTVFDMVYGLMALGMLGVYLLTSLLFLIWIYRANKNAHALGAVGMKFTPGWCVGWWFIPFANLFKPFQAVREIYQASYPRTTASNWNQVSVPALFGFWWALWLGSNILGQLEFRLAMNGDADLVTASSVVGVISGFVGVGSALTAMQVVRTIGRCQTEKARRV